MHFTTAQINWLEYIPRCFYIIQNIRPPFIRFVYALKISKATILSTKFRFLVLTDCILDPLRTTFYFFEFIFINLYVLLIIGTLNKSVRFYCLNFFKNHQQTNHDLNHFDVMQKIPFPKINYDIIEVDYFFQLIWACLHIIEINMSLNMETSSFFYQNILSDPTFSDEFFMLLISR